MNVPAIRVRIALVARSFSPEWDAQLSEWLTSAGYSVHRTRQLQDLDHSVATVVLLGPLRGVDPLLDRAIQTLRSNGSDVRFIACLGEGESVPPIDADDFVVAPIRAADLLLRVARLAGSTPDRSSAQSELERLAGAGLQGFIGNSPAFMEAISRIPRFAATGAAVLIAGETGTGKELCARAIHHLSPRASGPFVALTCGALPAELLESDMFAHASETSADAQTANRSMISEADGGTLFLDEVDMLPAAGQVRLVQFLQEVQHPEAAPAGPKRVDARVVAASTRDLGACVKAGSFREDLYYRLRVVHVALPPLRERAEDIPALATYFLDTATREYGRTPMRLTPAAITALQSCPWAGNVRELENVIREAALMAAGPFIHPSDLALPASFPPGDPEPMKLAKQRLVTAFERAYLQEMLASHHGNITHAARAARKDRRAFFALLKKHDLIPSANRLRRS